jgi:hypothetical protein
MTPKNFVIETYGIARDSNIQKFNIFINFIEKAKQFSLKRSKSNKSAKNSSKGMIKFKKRDGYKNKGCILRIQLHTYDVCFCDRPYSHAKYRPNCKQRGYE